MKRIYKFALSQQEHRRYLFSAGVKMLSVKAQYGDIVLYALVDEVDNAGTFVGEHYDFYIKGTGHMADNILDCNFLGTVKLMDGREMWHVFYRKVNDD
jgi:hypothetical protein